MFSKSIYFLIDNIAASPGLCCVPNDEKILESTWLHPIAIVCRQADGWQKATEVLPGHR